MTAAMCLGIMMAGKQARRIWATRSMDHPTDPVSIYRFIILAAGCAIARRAGRKPSACGRGPRRRCHNRARRRLKTPALSAVGRLQVPVNGAAYPRRADDQAPAPQSPTAGRYVVELAPTSSSVADSDRQRADGNRCRRTTVMREGAIVALPSVTIPVIWSFWATRSLLGL